MELFLLFQFIVGVAVTAILISTRRKGTAEVPKVTMPEGESPPLSQSDLPDPPPGSGFIAQLHGDEVIITCPSVLTTLIVTRSRLTLSSTGSFGFHWDRSIIAWVHSAPSCLQIGSPVRSTTLCAGHSREERRWLAEVLSQVLRLERSVPRKADELAVSYGSGGDGRLKPGFLSVQRGLLSLRFQWEETPDYGFFDPQLRGAASWARLALNQLPVGPDDVVGTDDEDGWCWINIVQGQVSVVIGCEDNAALWSALDRFQGTSRHTTKSTQGMELQGE